MRRTRGTKLGARLSRVPPLRWISGAKISARLSGIPLLRWISRARVSARLSGMALVLTALVVVVAAIGITGFTSVKHAYNNNQAPKQQLATLNQATNEWTNFDDQVNIYAALAALNDNSQETLMAATWGAALAAQSGTNQAMSKLAASPLTASEKTAVRTLQRNLTAYFGWADKFNTAMEKAMAAGLSTSVGHRQAIVAIRYITDDNSTVSNNVRTELTSLSVPITARQTSTGQKIPNQVSSSLRLTIIIAVVAILIAILLTIPLVRSITRPLKKITKAADSVSNGSANVELDVYGKHEIAQLAESFRGVVASRQTIAKVIDSWRVGDLDAEIPIQSEEDLLGHALVSYQAHLSEALGDTDSSREIHDGLEQLAQTLHTLKDAMGQVSSGDMRHVIHAELAPIAAANEGERIGFVAETYNEMIDSAQATIEGYNRIREMLRERLGDHSSLEGLSEQLEVLSSNDLAQLQQALEAMNDGDLTATVVSASTALSTREGEQLGTLGETFNEMLASTQAAIDGYNGMRAKISEILASISENSEALAAASSQMASTSEEAGRAVAEIANAISQVAAGAEHQVRSVDDAKRITDELSQASQLSAEAADETSAAAEEARGLARQGVSAAENASQAMQAVRDSSAETAEAIRSLGEKSDQIGGIVETITRIAAQTNLLALNAAIEAARAGEHGRGFAVVAEEVRHLAEESQQAAATIGALIEEIQHETTRAVDVVERGAGQTRSGVDTVEQARDAFVQIGQSVEDMSNRIEQIASAIRQIAASGDQMRATMNTVAAVAESSSASTQEVSASTEQTSASTQQIAASAQQLADTAVELEKLVGQFTLA